MFFLTVCIRKNILWKIKPRSFNYKSNPIYIKINIVFISSLVSYSSLIGIFQQPSKLKRTKYKQRIFGILWTVLAMTHSYGQTTTPPTQPGVAVSDNVEVNSTHTYEVAYTVCDGIPNQYRWIIYTSNGAYTKGAAAIPDIDFIMTAGVNASIQNTKWLKTGHFIIEMQEANPVVFGGCTGPLQSLDVNVGSTGTVEFLNTTGTNQCPATGGYPVDLSYTGTVSYPITVNVQYTMNGSNIIATIIVADRTAKLDIPSSIDFLNNTTTADDASRSIKITSVKDSFGDLTIKAKDTHTLTIWPRPAINLGNDTMLCAANELLLDAGEKGTFYKWSNGATSQTIMAHDGDRQIWVNVSDANGCVGADTINILQCSPQQKLEIANAFTPNGDGHNDYWQIKGYQNYPNMTIKIYDRWGNEVFRSDHGYDKPWDGNSGGKNMPTGAYYYVIKLGDGSKQITGSLTLIR